MFCKQSIDPGLEYRDAIYIYVWCVCVKKKPFLENRLKSPGSPNLQLINKNVLFLHLEK